MAATDEVNSALGALGVPGQRGVIAFDRDHEISFKVETHNHPSALEPGGANTGVGGVVRDVLGVSAEPIANTDVLCFGPLDTPADTLPPGTPPPERVYAGWWPASPTTATRWVSPRSTARRCSTRGMWRIRSSSVARSVLRRAAGAPPSRALAT